MSKPRVFRGEGTQGDTPDWRPLLGLVGERVTGDFMWMFEVVLQDGTSLHAYKHIGVTPEQVGASWAAVDRLNTHS